MSVPCFVCSTFTTAVISSFLSSGKELLNTMAEQTKDIDWNKLSPDNPDIMQYQATINVGKDSLFFENNSQEPLDTSLMESRQW